MKFDFSSDVRDLQQALRRHLEKACPTTRARAVLDGEPAEGIALYRELAKAGWMSAALPAAQGGQGLGMESLCAVAMELGRAIAPTPHGASILLAAEAIRIGGSPAQQAKHLRALGDGSSIATFALAERAGPLAEAGVVTEFRDGAISGCKIAVPWALHADVAVVAARSGSTVALYLLSLDQSGVERVAQQSLDPTQPIASLRFTAARAERLAGATHWRDIQSLLDRAAVLFAFEQIGTAEAALEMARCYALSRVAFGRLIGSFQAIKHKLAEVYIANEFARANAHYAAWALESDGADLPLAASTLRVAACEALERASRENMQIHGGVSATWANDCHLYYRRARHLGSALGGVQQWRDRAADLLIAQQLQSDGAPPPATDDTPDEAAFRADVRAWLAANAGPYLMSPGATAEQRLQLGRGWMQRKAAAGYAGIAMPKELGGRGGTVVEEIIFHEEELPMFMGSYDESFGGNLVGMAIPTMLTHAQPGWADRLIAKTLSGELLWCQLFSEPGAGSDLAGIRTRAIRNGDSWIINGQKIWTSGAQNADWGLLLTRSDPSLPKHKGLTYFLVDMHSPGVEVRPLKQISGRSDFNEVFFTDVRIPDTQRLGDVNGGWIVAMTTMMNERLSLMTEASTSRDILGPMIRVASRTPAARGGMLIDDATFRDRIASYYVAIAGMKNVRGRIRAELGRGHVPGPEATIGKVTIARWLQEMSIFAMDMLGAASEVVDVDGERDLAAIQEAFFLCIGYRIGGGTEEIAKNIISERLLGLPQEDRPDKSVPFSEAVSLGVRGRS